VGLGQEFRWLSSIRRRSSHAGGARSDAPLEGEIEVSADISSAMIPAVQRTFGDVGAIRVPGR
jgi:hypothetical protein